jgi:hypothetical protein
LHTSQVIDSNKVNHKENTIKARKQDNDKDSQHSQQETVQDNKVKETTKENKDSQNNKDNNNKDNVGLHKINIAARFNMIGKGSGAGFVLRRTLSLRNQMQRLFPKGVERVLNTDYSIYKSSKTNNKLQDATYNLLATKILLQQAKKHLIDNRPTKPLHQYRKALSTKSIELDYFYKLFELESEQITKAIKKKCFTRGKTAF